MHIRQTYYTIFISILRWTLSTKNVWLHCSLIQNNQTEPNAFLGGWQEICHLQAVGIQRWKRQSLASIHRRFGIWWGVCASVVYPDGHCPHWNLESHNWISLNLAHRTFQILSSTTGSDCQMSLGRHIVSPTCCHSNDNALRCWSTLCVSPLLHYGLWISHQSWFARVWYRTPAAQETQLETSVERSVIQLHLL